MMKIAYNVTGEQRKALVDAISQALNAPTKYLGASTFAYEAGGYHIDKIGTVAGADNEDLVTLLEARGFTGELTHDDDKMDSEEIAEASESNRFTVELPLEGFAPETLDNLTKMVKAKSALIKQALGADDLPIQMTDGTLKFSWFTLSNPSEAAYYIQFIYALCKTAKRKKRVIAKECADVSNAKYSMRCWLLSLGLIGLEYKNARKLLLSRLSGNGSFKGGSRLIYIAHCLTYPSGSEEGAMDCETVEFTSLAKAKARCDEFARNCESLKYAGAHVEDANGKYLYELSLD